MAIDMIDVFIGTEFAQNDSIERKTLLRNFSSSDGTGHHSLAAEALGENFGRFAVGREAAEDGASALWEAHVNLI